MRVELTEIIWLEERATLSEAELIEATGLSESELSDLVETGAIVALDSGTNLRAFSSRTVEEVRTARRIRRDFGLNDDGTALAMHLLKRIRELEAEIGHLRAQHAGRIGTV